MLAGALAMATAVSGIGLVLATAPAQAAETLVKARQITTVPADIVSVTEGTTNRASSSTAGGPGSAAANHAVRAGCATGSAYADPQWYTLPGWSGKVAIREINHPPYFVQARPASFAVLNADTLAVVSCSPSVITLNPAYPRLLVAYYPSHYECTEDQVVVYGCSEARNDYHLSWTSGQAPLNDDWQDATNVGALPYQASVDTTFATLDGPDFQPSSDCFGFGTLTASTWWTFTPSTTGPLWIQSGAIWGERSYVHVVPALSGGGPDLDAESLAGCGGLSQPLTAGTTYYVAVYNAHDDTDFYTFTGSKALLRIAAGQAAMPPDRGVFLSTNPAAHSATIEWQSWGSPGGYRVARNGTDSNGVGPWSTVVPDVYPTQFTFTHLRPWTAYQLSVTPIFGPGIPGYPVARAVFLSAPTPSVPRKVTATGGDHKAKVTWKAPAYIGGSVVNKYRIRRYAATGSAVLQTVVVAATARSYTFTGLTPGKRYRFDVTAFNTAGKGVVSARTHAVTVRAH